MDGGNGVWPPVSVSAWLFGLVWRPHAPNKPKEQAARCFGLTTMEKKQQQSSLFDDAAGHLLEVRLVSVLMPFDWWPMSSCGQAMECVQVSR